MSNSDACFYSNGTETAWARLKDLYCTNLWTCMHQITNNIHPTGLSSLLLNITLSLLLWILKFHTTCKEANKNNMSTLKLTENKLQQIITYLRQAYEAFLMEHYSSNKIKFTSCKNSNSSHVTWLQFF